MNQITLDSALNALTKGAVPAAVLLEEQNYQALLNLGKEGVGQLKLQTPQGLITLQDAKLNIPGLQGQVIVQVSQSSSGQLQLKFSQNGPQPLPVQLTQPQLQQLMSQLTNLLPASVPTVPQQALSATVLSPQLLAQLSTQLTAQSSSTTSKNWQVPVQIQRQDQQLLLLSGQQKVQVPLPAALQSLPASKWLDAQLQLKSGQLSLVLPKALLNSALPLPTIATTDKTNQAQTKPMQGNSGPAAATTNTANKNQLLNVPLNTTNPQPQTQSPTQAPAQILDQTQRVSAAPPGSANPQIQPSVQPKPLSSSPSSPQVLATGSSVILLPAAVQQKILPLVLNQLTSSVSGLVLRQEDLKQLPLPAAMKQQLVDPQYQLQLTPQGQLQLKAIPEQKTIVIEAQPKVLQVQSSKTEQNQTVSGTVETTKFVKPQIEPAALNQAWRQLLPMLNPEWENLAEIPDLPEAVKAILQLVRQSQPDASKLTNLAQLPAQLQALLQFNPLQNVTMPQTAAGTLAVAIQLLLGRLGQTLPQNDKGPNKDHKLKEFVAQLDQTQSSQLLKQLSSQSSSMQHAQLSTLEQQSKDPLQQIFLTLPIQNQQVSDFCQIAITQQEEEQEKGKGKSVAWQLSMKFDLKQLGQLLAISKLSGSSLSLQLYTDTSMLKLLAEKYLPLLKDRCKAQGIDVKEAHCQLGKIPDSLMPKTTSLLAIRV